MKRFAVLLLTLAMAFCCAAPAFAAGTIEVTGLGRLRLDPLSGPESHPERLQLGRIHLQRLR